MKQKHSVPVKPSLAEEMQVAELLRSAKPGSYKLLQLVRKVDIKKLGAALGAALVAASAVSVTSRYKFYRSITAAELKKQLNTVNQKLDALQAQNLALQAELARLNEKQPETEEQTAKD